MSEEERKAIENLIAAEPAVYGLQADIDRAQARAVADLVSPAATVVGKLMELDNKRVDLCNIKVLNEYVRRELGDDYPRFLRAVSADGDELFERARKAIEKAGYTPARIEAEFSYIFARIKKNRTRVAVLSALSAVGAGEQNYARRS